MDPRRLSHAHSVWMVEALFIILTPHVSPHAPHIAPAGTSHITQPHVAFADTTHILPVIEESQHSVLLGLKPDRAFHTTVQFCKYSINSMSTGRKEKHTGVGKCRVVIQANNTRINK